MTEVPTTHRNPLRTAPNLLTVMRICLAPFLVAAILEIRLLAVAIMSLGTAAMLSLAAVQVILLMLTTEL